MTVPPDFRQRIVHEGFHHQELGKQAMALFLPRSRQKRRQGKADEETGYFLAMPNFSISS